MASPKAEPSAMSGGLRPEHGTARQGDQGGQHDAADLTGLGGDGAEALRGVVPAVAGQEPGEGDEEPADGRDEENPPPRGAGESPRWSGMVVQRKSVRCCSSQTNPMASRATGMPMSAAITRDWRYARGSMACCGGARWHRSRLEGQRGHRAAR